MKSLKKTLVLLVVLSMILTVIAPVFAFTDNLGNYEDQVNKMVALGVLNGYAEDGTFKAEGNITRAEMAKIICIITGSTQALADASKSVPSRFSDVPAGEWYTGWVNIATGSGIINGFPDGTFRPSENLTVNQALTLVVKALGRGAFVDQLGSWPGNYVQDAAKLGITKDMVVTGSELANRGNVAIICWNALTVGVWDVTSTTLAGEITLSSSGTGTLLSNYFKDFATEGNTTHAGQLKLVEDVTVYGTPLQDAQIGTAQIKFDVDDIEVDGEAIVTDSKPRRDSETSTYATADYVIAYVPSTVYANIANLLGKKVDVLFGKDNKVALIVVVDETINNAYVTAWDDTDETIKIADAEYDLATGATVSVFGARVESSVDDIITAMNPNNATRTFDRNLIANVILDEDDEVKSIDFMFSEEYVEDSSPDAGDIKVEVGVVEKVSSTGKFTMIDAATELSAANTEDFEDEIRVVKNNALIAADDIEANDVVTVISEYDAVATDYVVTTVFVSDTTALGTAEKVRNGNITIAGKVYNAIEAPLFNDDDDITEPKSGLDATDFYTEDVEAYLTFTGEIAAVVAKSDTIDTTLGVITQVLQDDENDNGDTCLKVKILKNDGTKAIYRVYNKTSGKDYDEGTYGIVKSDFIVGTLVLFSADSNKVIKTDKIEIIDTSANAKGYKLYLSDAEGRLQVIADHADPTPAGKIEVTDAGVEVGDIGKYVAKVEYKVDGEDVNVIGLTAATADYDDRKIAGHKFISSSVAYNLNDTAGDTTDEEMGTITGWDSLCFDDNSLAISTASTINGTALLKYVLLVNENDRIIYLAATIPAYASTTEEYAVVKSIDFDLNEEDEKVYLFTLFVNGVTLEPIEISCAFTGIEEGDLVSYTLADDTIDSIVKKVEVTDIAELDPDEILSTYIAGEANIISAATTKEALTFDELLDGIEINYIEIDDVALDEITVDEDGYIVYDLRAGGCTMFTGDLEDLIGELVIGFATESGDVDILVIVD